MSILPLAIFGHCQGVPDWPAGHWIFTGLPLWLNQHGSPGKAVFTISQLVICGFPKKWKMDVIKNTSSIDYESPSLQWWSSTCAQICIFKSVFVKMISRNCTSHLDMVKVWIPRNPLVLLWYFHIGASLRLLLHARLLQVPSSISSISIVILTIPLPIAYVPSTPLSASVWRQ